MGKNQNTGSHRTKIIFCEIKIIFHHFGTLAGFPARVIVQINLFMVINILGIIIYIYCMLVREV
jgi:hypothetical protein